MDGGGTAVARRMWVRFEPYHDVTYFTPESRAAADAVGAKGFWMGYFGMRAAPLGAVGADRVTELFYTFAPRMVTRAVPDVWDRASPEQYLAARLAGVDAALRRTLGDDVVEGEAIAEAARLARHACDAATTDGLPLGAANAALPWPDEPHLALWHAATVLREARGDAHIAALVAAGIGPCEALVLHAAHRDIDRELLREARRWTDEEWDATAAALAGRGLLDADGAITDEGRELRERVETATDESAAQPWAALGAERTTRLAELLTPVALTVVTGNPLMQRSPTGLDAVAELS